MLSITDTHMTLHGAVKKVTYWKMGVNIIVVIFASVQGSAAFLCGSRLKPGRYRNFVHTLRHHNCVRYKFALQV